MPRENLESLNDPYALSSGLPSYEQILAALGYSAPAAAPAQNYGALDWGTAASLVPMGRAAWDTSSEPDAAKANRDAFKATDPQNAALLAQLSGGAADPLAALASQGYSVGVGHQPGTSAGGRAEYYGLIDPSGNFVQGQAAPTMIQSDTLMDNITPFLLMAPALAGVAAAGGAGAGLAGGASGLGATADGVTALGSAWSPQALGLTGSIAPGVTAGELASLSAALPEIGAGLGAAGGLSTLGGGASGVSSLGAGMSPQALGLTQAIAPGATAADIAGLSQALPGAVSAGAGASIGGSGGLSSADKAAMLGNDGYGAGMTGAQTSAYDGVLGATGSKAAADVVANSGIGSGLLNGVKSAADLVGGGQNLAALVGAVGGAASGGGTTTGTMQNQIDPRMAQYLYGTGYGDANSLLGAAQQYWQQNKSGLNPTMQQGLDMQRSALQDPAYGQAYTQMRSVGQGLLSQPIAGNPFTNGQTQAGVPMAQAGGAGGLLGGNFTDRAKALMTSGRGLLG